MHFTLTSLGSKYMNKKYPTIKPIETPTPKPRIPNKLPRNPIFFNHSKNSTNPIFISRIKEHSDPNPFSDSLNIVHATHENYHIIKKDNNVKEKKGGFFF